MYINNAENNLKSIMKHSLIVFGLAMLVHSFMFVIINIPLPQTLFQILKTLSITLINDVAFLIDLIRGHFPVEYSPSEILMLSMIPWLIAGLFGIKKSFSIWDTFQSASIGVLLAILVLSYLWVGIGGLTFIGVFLSFQFFIGLVLSVALTIIGGVAGIKLRVWFQKTRNTRLNESNDVSNGKKM